MAFVTLSNSTVFLDRNGSPVANGVLVLTLEDTYNSVMFAGPGNVSRSIQFALDASGKIITNPAQVYGSDQLEGNPRYFFEVFYDNTFIAPIAYVGSGSGYYLKTTDAQPVDLLTHAVAAAASGNIPLVAPNFYNANGWGPIGLGPVAQPPIPWGTEPANEVLAGPTSGSAQQPTFRALVSADLPSVPSTKITGQVALANGGTGLDLSATAGVAVKPTAMGHQFVMAANGNDSNDGLSWGSPKATIAAAIAALPIAGGIVETLSGHRETITSTINLGSSTQQVCLLFNPDTLITVNITDGLSDAFVLHRGSCIRGLSEGQLANHTGGASILVANTANMGWIINQSTGSDASTGVSYTMVEKLFIYGDSSATLTGAINMYIALNMSVVRDVYIANVPAIGLQIATGVASSTLTTGPLLCENVWVDLNSLTGARPLVITTQGASCYGLTFIGCMFSFPAVGGKCIEINGNGHNDVIKSIGFTNCYVLDGTGGNSTGWYIRDAKCVNLFGCSGDLHGTCTAIDINESSAALTEEINVVGFHFGAASGTVLSNSITGESFGTATATLTYHYGTETGSTIQHYDVHTTGSNGMALSSNLVLTNATPTGTGAELGLGNTTGFGNGSSGTAVTTTTKGTGTGPTTPQTVVKYLEVNLGGTPYWVGLVQ